jgi:hypothetical protein
MSKKPNKQNQRLRRSSSDRDRDEITLDNILEKWEHTGSYKDFFNRHVKTLGLTKVSSEEARETLKRALQGVKALDIPWSRMSPKERSRIIANLSKRMRDGDLDDCFEREKGPKGTKKKKKDRDDDDDCDDDSGADRHRNQRGRGHDDDKPGERKGHKKCKKKPKKKKKIKKRKCHKPPKGERPKPPRCDPPDEEDPDEEPEVPPDEEDPPDTPPPYEPPIPEPPESPPPITPGPTKEFFSSRIGYFTSLSELTFYTEEPALYQTPDIEFSFQDTEESYLSLAGGDAWTSEWQEGPVIRGLDLSINGQHRLKYSSNGDFEIG